MAVDVAKNMPFRIKMLWFTSIDKRNPWFRHNMNPIVAYNMFLEILMMAVILGANHLTEILKF